MVFDFISLLRDSENDLLGKLLYDLYLFLQGSLILKTIIFFSNFVDQEKKWGKNMFRCFGVSFRCFVV